MPHKEKLNGLDLFSGIAGITIALGEWVRPVAYCENEGYAQGVLLSRMESGDIPIAPIWDDVKTLEGNMFQEIDIIYGGFPCQDISVAGAGVGLGGERSGLFFEIIRLAKETKPTFVFLENVPAIRTRGLDRVIQEFTEIGYDCRWTMLSAADVGANHRRQRWFLLANRIKPGLEGYAGDGAGGSGGPEADGSVGESCLCGNVANAPQELPHGAGSPRKIGPAQSSNCCSVPDNDSLRVEGARTEQQTTGLDQCFRRDWWAVEPDVDRVVNGIPSRVDRLKCIGNAVVPLQAKEAFKILMGLK